MKLTKLAQELYDMEDVNEDDNLTKEQRDFRDDISCSDGFDYGLYEGGYVVPKEIVEGDDLAELEKAIKLVGKFRDIWEHISLEL